MSARCHISSLQSQGEVVVLCWRFAAWEWECNHIMYLADVHVLSVCVYIFIWKLLEIIDRVWFDIQVQVHHHCDNTVAYLRVCVCVDLWSMEESGEASHTTAAVWAVAHQHDNIDQQTRGSGGEDHQTQGAVCWYVWDILAFWSFIIVFCYFPLDMCIPLSLCYSTQ